MVCESGCIKIFFMCMIWWLASSCNNILAKHLFSEISFSVTLSLVNFTAVTLFLPVIMPYLSVPDGQKTSMRKFSVPRYLKIVLPLAFLKAVATNSSLFSVSKVAVSYSATVKASQPFFAVMLAFVLQGETYPIQVYLSILPIVGGIAIATWSEGSATLLGISSALLSCFLFSLTNVLTKKRIVDLKIFNKTLLWHVTMTALVLTFIFWLNIEAFDVLHHPVFLENTGRIMAGLVAYGSIMVIQTSISFTVLNLLTNLSYAVTNTLKRVFVICLSVITLKNPVTVLNSVGIVITIFGAFLYNYQTSLIRARKHREEILPRVQSTPYLSANSSLGDNTDVLRANGDVSRVEVPSDEQFEAPRRSTIFSLVENFLRSLIPFFQVKSKLPEISFPSNDHNLPNGSISPSLKRTQTDYRMNPNLSFYEDDMGEEEDGAAAVDNLYDKFRSLQQSRTSFTFGSPNDSFSSIPDTQPLLVPSNPDPIPSINQFKISNPVTTSTPTKSSFRKKGLHSNAKVRFESPLIPPITHISDSPSPVSSSRLNLTFPQYIIPHPKTPIPLIVDSSLNLSNNP